MKMLIAGKIKKTEMGSDHASFKIAELCKCGQHIAGTDCAALKKGEDKKATYIAKSI